jgi:hypothetical protein
MSLQEGLISFEQHAFCDEVLFVDVDPSAIGGATALEAILNDPGLEMVVVEDSSLHFGE